MVETRQNVLGVGYSPTGGDTGGVPIELRRFPETNVLRGPVRRQPVRPDFHVVGLITSGQGLHAVDFQKAALTEGAVFWLRPGQVHQVVDAYRLRGVLVLFTAEMLAPGTPVAAFADDAVRPSQWRADPHDLLVGAAVRHLELLLEAPGPGRDIADALRLLLGPLVRAAPSAPEGAGTVPAVFARFAAAVEADYPRRHHVRDYEQAIHASARTIDRSVRRVKGVSAKRFLDERIALQARRQLATTEAPVAALAQELGFTEATNFVKFYRRMTGTTPRVGRASGRTHQPSAVDLTPLSDSTVGLHDRPVASRTTPRREHGPVTFTVQVADHTGITVSDLERSLVFWRDVLGFELSHRAQLTGEFAAGVTGVLGAEISIAVVVAPGGHSIELLQYHQPADRAHLRPRPCDVGSVHLAVTVDDIDAVLETSADFGWLPAGAPQTMTSDPRAGTRLAYMHDPDGTTVELIQGA